MNLLSKRITMLTTHHVLKGGAMKPGWAVLITVLVLGAVAGIVCGIYYGTLNKASQYIPPNPKTSLPVSTKPFMNTCDGKVVNPAIPCMSFTNQPRTRAGVSSNCGNCTASEVCENGACAPLCQPKCTDNTCVGTGTGSGLPDGCGGTCCGCTDTQTCVNGKCVSPSKPCPSGCLPGQICDNGVCTGGCGTACPQGETCVNGGCQSNASLCSPACNSNETCVLQTDGTYKCKCAPNCPANTCGSDGCGGTCSCPSGQTCNASKTCVSCAPVCSKGTCGNPDGCGGTCGCSVGEVCSSNNTCVTDTSPWEGWATTTQFGSGDPTWGNVDPLEGLANINDDSAKRMGGAVPWIELCTKYGSKQNQVQTTVDSAAGKNSVKACYLVQPINKYPDQISGITDPLFPNAPRCDPTKGPCTDINDPSLQATDKTGKPFDTFLIVPFEGCGGDCNVTAGSGADCINDCVASQDKKYAFDDSINGGLCQWNKLQNPLCDAAKVLYNDGNWGWNSTIQNNFLKYSRPLAISPDTDYGRNITKAAGTGHANFCTGQNMHLDMADTTPYWTLNPNGMGDIAQTSANTNILLRYKRVPCNYYGNVDINAPLSKDIECPKGYTWTNLNDACNPGETRLNPGDAAWPRSGIADHACCGTPVNPTPSQCGVGQVFQVKGGACPCPKDQCFYNALPSADGTGMCGQCSGSVSACDAGVKC